MREFWTAIFHEDIIAMLKVNQADMKALEGKAPGVYRRDREDLYKKIRSRELFSAFTD
jgi:Protein of unknown function (DUF3723)